MAPTASPDADDTRRLSAVVLAAGHGTRMRSETPKPIHLLVGKPMVVWVLDALAACDVEEISVVIGHGGEAVRKRIEEETADRPVRFAVQEHQNGTGDAAMVGLTGLSDNPYDGIEDVLVLTADTPLLRPETVAAVVERHRATDAACTVLTAELDDPHGYGRIVRGRDDRVMRIVEQRDCTEPEEEIREINTGIFCFRRTMLTPALRRITPDNAQSELYLTDVVEVLAEAGHGVSTLIAGDPGETHGVNDRAQLAAAERVLRGRINRGLMGAGVTLVDPDTTFVDATATIEQDVTLFPHVVIQGRTRVATGVEIGAGTHLVDADVGPHARLLSTHAIGATVGANAVVGPFAALGPGDDVPSGQVTGPHYAGANTRSGADPSGTSG